MSWNRLSFILQICIVNGYKTAKSKYFFGFLCTRTSLGTILFFILKELHTKPSLHTVPISYDNWSIIFDLSICLILNSLLPSTARCDCGDDFNIPLIPASFWGHTANNFGFSSSLGPWLSIVGSTKLVIFPSSSSKGSDLEKIKRSRDQYKQAEWVIYSHTCFPDPGILSLEPNILLDNMSHIFRENLPNYYQKR